MFSIGSVVQLKSGGPPMTVAGIEPAVVRRGTAVIQQGTVCVMHFDSAGVCHKGYFPPETLMLAPPPAVPEGG